MDVFEIDLLLRPYGRGTCGKDTLSKNKRLDGVISKLRDGPDAPTQSAKGREKTDKPVMIIISVDVHELGLIEMEVGSVMCEIALRFVMRILSRDENLESVWVQ